MISNKLHLTTEDNREAKTQGRKENDNQQQCTIIETKRKILPKTKKNRTL